LTVLRGNSGVVRNLVCNATGKCGDNRSVVAVALLSEYLCLVLSESGQAVVFPLSVVNVFSLNDSSGARDFQMTCSLVHIVVKHRVRANNPASINIFQRRIQETQAYSLGESEYFTSRASHRRCRSVGGLAIPS
jgi:hypothetical protein